MTSEQCCCRSRILSLCRSVFGAAVTLPFFAVWLESQCSENNSGLAVAYFKVMAYVGYIKRVRLEVAGIMIKTLREESLNQA